MKICYLINSLTISKGGIERITTDKVNLLSKNPNYEVSIITLYKLGSTRPLYPIAENVYWGNCGCYFLPKTTFRKNPILYIYQLIQWKIGIYKHLKSELQKINPDIVISTCYSKTSIPFTTKAKVVLESHIDTENYIAASSYSFCTNLKIQLMKRLYNTIVTLTTKDAAFWKGKANVVVIPNFSNITPVGECEYKAKRVIAVGRLCKQKGFDMLIEAWGAVHGRHPSWVLDIYGNGMLYHSLQAQIDKANLQEYILLQGVNDNITQVYSEHSIFVLSSRYEGFGLVLLEAMTCGCACVSFDCPAGPSDMIDDMQNGLLVEYRNLSREERVRNLTDAICYLIEHEDERIRMGKAAMEKTKQFDKEIIMTEWDALFKSLIQN